MEHHEVVIIGAGLSGIFQLYRLREAGFDVAVVEASDGVGGTWFKNRYPGARFDSESYTYGYSFSKELLQEWSWSEHFAPQPETLRYLNHVVEKFDLARHIQELAPAHGNNGPNPEYPWPPTLPTSSPLVHPFAEWQDWHWAEPTYLDEAGS